jgi:lincosamide nucleotidyltransferase A/C/D/E
VTGKDVSDLVRFLEASRTEVWLDGGWAVDALVGRQTRQHDDVDIVVRESDLPVLLPLLSERGYVRVERGRPFNFGMRDADGRKIDVHTVVFDAEGNGLYGPPSAGGQQEMYRAGALTGSGIVDGQRVRTVTPGALMTYYAGYPITPTDLHDVRQLHERFGIELPAEYRRPVTVRPAVAGDVTILHQVLADAPEVPLDSVLAALVAEEDGKPVGAALIWRGRLILGVLLDRAGSRVPLELLNAALAEAKTSGEQELTVTVPAKATRFYERSGFEQIRRAADTVTLRLDLVKVHDPASKTMPL